MQVPFVDLKKQYSSIKSEIDNAILGFIATTQFVGGPAVTDFETAFAELHGAKYCVGTSTGTSALHLSLWALGIGPGDSVILPVNTFIATAEAVSLTGAVPVFVDHDDLFNLDTGELRRVLAGKIKRGSGAGNFKAIIPVHLYGQLCDMNTVLENSRQYNLAVVEDCCQAHLAHCVGESPEASSGASYAGTLGQAGAFSFYPGKNLGAFGEGGAVITDDDALQTKMRALRNHGATAKYRHEMAGHNYRIEGMQATVLQIKMKYLEQWTEKRRANARLYDDLLQDVAEIATPETQKNSYHVYHLYVVRAKERDPLGQYLNEQGIATGLHYPVPLHLQKAYSHLGYQRGDFPQAEKSCDEILSLPMFPELEAEQIKYVVETIKAFYAKKHTGGGNV